MKQYLLLVTSCITFSAFADIPPTVTDAQNLGNAALGNSAGAVTQTNADVITKMNPATSADTTTVTDLQAQFAVSNAGNSGLGTQGQSQVNKCTSYVPNLALLSLVPPDPVESARQQECLAVSYLAGQPLQHAFDTTGLTKSDSLFQNPDNMFNTGNTNAALISGGAVSSIGSGVAGAGGGISGAGACITTTQTSPALYSNGSCTRSAATTTQTCQVVSAPTVTKTPYCNIGGGTLVPWQFGWNPTTGGTQVWSADVSPAPTGWGNSYHGTIVYKCRPTTDPLYALGGIAQFVQNQAWTNHGGWLNFIPGIVTVNFTKGVTSNITSVSTAQYSGTHLFTTRMYYDGPSDQFYVSVNLALFYTLPFWEPAQGVYPPLVSCAPGYTLAKYKDPNYTESICSPGDGCWTTNNIGETYSYCTSPSDPSSVAYPQPKPIVDTVIAPNTFPLIYQTCTATGWGQTDCVLKDGYATSGYVGTVSSNNGTFKCWSGSCPIYKLTPCASGFTWHPVVDGNPEGKCLPSKYEIPLTIITNDRALRLYASASGHYSGSAGVTNTLNDNVNDSCQTLQSQTANPTATLAVSVNGVFTCPAGKQLSGSLCL